MGEEDHKGREAVGLATGQSLPPSPPNPHPHPHPHPPPPPLTSK